MSEAVRHFKLGPGQYAVHDRKSNRWLGDVWHDVAADEWYAYAEKWLPNGNIALSPIGTARTRAAATDLILQATGSQT